MARSVSQNRGGSAEEDEDIDALDNAPISWLLKSRNREKSETRKKDFEVRPIVVSDDVQSQDSDGELGVSDGEEELSYNATGFRARDLVWAKAMPSTWWPGWICRKSRGKVLVTLFDCKRSRYFRESEILDFEKNFQAMSNMARGKSLEAIESALAELGHRLIIGLTCPCQSDLGKYNGGGQQRLTKEIVLSKEKVFQPVEVLRFVRLVAISPWIDGPEEALSAVRSGAQLNALRSYICIKRDWIYHQTMRLSDTGLATDDSEADSTYSVTQEADILDGEQKYGHNVFLERVEEDSGICKEKKGEHLHEILTHLCCLALDPFYTGARELQAENSIAVCQKILKYRGLVYQKNIDAVRGKHTAYHDYKVEVSRENKMSRLNSVSRVGSVAADTLLENNVVIANGDGTEESQILSNVFDSSNSVVNERRDDAKADCNLAYMKEVPAVEAVVEDAVTLVKHFPDHNGETQIKKIWEIFGLNSALQLCETVNKIGTENDKMKKPSRIDSVSVPSFMTTETQLEYTDTKTIDTHGSRFLYHILEDPVIIHHCNMNSIDDRNMDTEVDFSLNHVLEASPKEVFEDVMDCDDKAGFQSGKTRKSQPSSQLSDNLVRSRPVNEIGSIANITKRRNGFGVPSEDRSEGKTRPSQSAASNFSVELQQEKSLSPLKLLYATPLKRNCPISSVNATFQSSKTNIHSENPTSLHMKFPKDFELPSKNELLKQFCQFGPLDHSKTRVFFYTGSAEVVFLHHLDAEAAFHYAKRKKIFFGRANVRFWLGRREHSRAGATKISAPLPFSTLGSSALSLKSCLKTSNLEEGNKKRKLHQVRFATGTQINSLSASITDHGNFMLLDSCEFDGEVGPNISVQMLVLLERCSQLVSTVKENLGLQSYYSIFTQGT